MASAAALFMALCLTLSGCIIAPPQQQKRKAVFIFCDVTGSLIKQESEQVVTLAADILDRLPPDAVYRLLPVHMNTESAEPILQTNTTVDSKKGLSETGKEERRKKIHNEISKLYAEVNAPERQPERTCMLGGLARAAEFFANLDRQQYDYELVFISDMIEHCQNNPAGREKTINLMTQAPADAFKIIADAPLPSLANIHITIIVPGANERIGRVPRPTKETLHKFWGQVFKKCSNEGVSINDWITGAVPDRVFPPRAVAAAR